MRKQVLLPVLLILSLLILNVGFTCGLPGAPGAETAIRNQPSRTPAQDRESQSVTSQDKSAMLQFRAGGHILGFQPDKAYLASLDHALSVRFLGTKGVEPKVIESGMSEPRAGTPGLGTVRYQTLWEGIDLIYEATAAGIAESTYHVAPGADVSHIRLRYNAPVEAQKDGSLTFRFENGYLTESAPVAWQDIEGTRVPVKVAFRVSGDEIGFTVGKYDTNRPLVIDPTYAWHTFYGTTFDEQGNSIALDGNGNIYVTGSVGKTWDGPANTPPLNAFNGGTNIFVVKLNSSGAYQWHTFHGNIYGSDGKGIAVDGNGNVYVTGYSTKTWNGPANTPPLKAFAGGLFLLKLDTNGAYLWHTFCGGGTGNAIALDGGGGVYIAGYSGAWNGPAPDNKAPLHAFTPNPDPNLPTGDILVLKLDTNGTYQWHTFYGSNIDDMGNSIAIGNGGVYVTGASYKSWAAPTAPLHTFSGGGMGNLLVLKLNGNGVYQWHTFYGTLNGATGHGVAADSNGNVYVAGRSYDSWNGPAGASQPPLHGFTGSAGFITNMLVMKLDAAGAYQWHTYYGNTTSYWTSSIALDGNGGVYVAGDGSGTWNGPANQPPLHPIGSGRNLVVLKLDTAGAYQWHDFYGGAFSSFTYGMVLQGGDNIYVTGKSSGSWNGPAGASQPPLHGFTFMGGNDMVVMKMGTTPPTVTTSSVSGITAETAIGGGNVTSPGETAVTARGVCWGTSTNPTTGNSCTSDGTGTGAFVSSITDLLPGTPYHARAYATNTGGTSYGTDVPFTSGPARSLASGWNFISFPKLPGKTTIASVLSEISSNIAVLWAYDNTDKIWKKWQPGGQTSITNVEFGQGYWIYMTVQDYLDITDWASPSPPSTTVQLSEGWNLVGYLGTNNTVAATALNGIASKWEAVWMWENSVWSGKHATIQTLPEPHQPLSVFSQGKGYWIKIKKGEGPVSWVQP